MRCLLVTIVAACSAPSIDSPPDALTQHGDEELLPVIHGAHGSSIDIVAVASDGTAAISQDATGNTRLWTTLDGTVEPVVVHLAAAEELAIVRGREEFALFALDPSGGLHFVRTSLDGRAKAHAQLDRDVAVEQLAVTSTYALALRKDQTIAVIDRSGHERRLETPAGSRTIAIAARSDHAVALVVRGGAAHVRPFDPIALTWGTEVGAFATPSSRFALSPNGAHLAYAAGTEIRVLDLATGMTNATCEGTPNQIPVGFVDDTTVACLGAGELGWYPAAGGTIVQLHPAPDPEHVAYGGTVQVTGEGLALNLSNRRSFKFLGYRLADPSALRTGPLGLSIAHNSPPLVIDRSLRVVQTIAVDTLAYEDALPLDATHVLRTEPAFAGHQIVLADTVAKTTAKVAVSTEVYLHFEPATNLLAVAGERSSLIPYSPLLHRFGTPIDLGERSKVFLTDPKLADGTVAISIVDGSDRSKQVHAYKAGGVRTRSYEIDGDVIAVDRAGRVYVAFADTVYVYVAGLFDEGTQVMSFATTGRPVIAIDRGAANVLISNDNKISLLDLQGHVRWSVAAPTAIDVSWVDDEPIARFPGGLARLDRRSGRLIARACGWQFGLTDVIPENPGNNTSVCDAE